MVTALGFELESANDRLPCHKFYDHLPRYCVGDLKIVLCFFCVTVQMARLALSESVSVDFKRILSTIIYIGINKVGL